MGDMWITLYGCVYGDFDIRCSVPYSLARHAESIDYRVPGVPVMSRCFMRENARFLHTFVCMPWRSL